MAKLRNFIAYRRIERAYTRRSKFRKKAFIKVNPNVGIVRFVMGDTTEKKFGYTLLLKTTKDTQIRNFAIEAGRQTANRVMEKKAGKMAYRMVVRIFPHHILRENPLAAGAGADRMSTGMAHSFGKPIGLAARVFEDSPICQVDCEKSNIENAREALRRYATKLPIKCYVEVMDNERQALI
ncbi:MAG TPA: 50S ribosomal protein L16 [Candidatus Nanoarchaeia archaeon]|nr:50S ribosomal protein L16 [Candidatus Nanoarchaeia archaeon]